MPPRPEDRLRRGFIYRKLDEHGAVFGEIGDSVAAMHYGDAASEAQQARILGIADLSPLDRTGFKGPNALDWLARHGVRGLDTDHRAHPQPGGDLVVRLAPTEALVVGGLDGQNGLCGALDSAFTADPEGGCYAVMRRDASFHFAVTGTEGPVMMAKLCGVDLRRDRFPPGWIAQTIVARLPTIVIRWDIGDLPALHLFGDSASAGYLWDCVVDAMAEYGGRPVGLAALRESS